MPRRDGQLHRREAAQLGTKRRLGAVQPPRVPSMHRKDRRPPLERDERTATWVAQQAAPLPKDVAWLEERKHRAQLGHEELRLDARHRHLRRCYVAGRCRGLLASALDRAVMGVITAATRRRCTRAVWTAMPQRVSQQRVRRRAASRPLVHWHLLGMTDSTFTRQGSTRGKPCRLRASAPTPLRQCTAAALHVLLLVGVVVDAFVGPPARRGLVSQIEVHLPPAVMRAVSAVAGM